MTNGIGRLRCVLRAILPAIMLVGCVCESGITPCGDLREAIRCELCAEVWGAVSDEKSAETVQMAVDVVDALEKFDKYIVPTFEGHIREERIIALRRQIEEGKSWMYYCDISEDDTFYYFVNLFPSCEYFEYGFFYYVSFWIKSESQFYCKEPCSCFLKLHSRDNILGFHYSNSYYEDYINGLPRIIDAVDDWAENWEWEERGIGVGKAEITAIVDVVDVQLVNINGIGFCRRHFPSAGCQAEYHIRLDVRKVERGKLSSASYILVRRPFWDEFMFERRWAYYRGMTLRVKLQVDRNGEIYMVESSLVEPCPPYGVDMRINGGALVGRDTSEKSSGRLEPLVIEYGPHTKVQFEHGDIIMAGNEGKFVDFGVTSKFKVLELKEGANKTYWENAWFVTGNATGLVGDVCHSLSTTNTPSTATRSR